MDRESATIEKDDEMNIPVRPARAPMVAPVESLEDYRERMRKPVNVNDALEAIGCQRFATGWVEASALVGQYEALGWSLFKNIAALPWFGPEVGLVAGGVGDAPTLYLVPTTANTEHNAITVSDSLGTEPPTRFGPNTIICEIW